MMESRKDNHVIQAIGIQSCDCLSDLSSTGLWNSLSATFRVCIVNTMCHKLRTRGWSERALFLQADLRLNSSKLNHPVSTE